MIAIGSLVKRKMNKLTTRCYGRATVWRRGLTETGVDGYLRSGLGTEQSGSFYSASEPRELITTILSSFGAIKQLYAMLYDIWT